MFQKMKNFTLTRLWPWMKTLTFGQLLIFTGLVYVGNEISDLRSNFSWSVSRIPSELSDIDRELSGINRELSNIDDKLGSIARNIR